MSQEETVCISLISSMVRLRLGSYHIIDVIMSRIYVILSRKKRENRLVIRKRRKSLLHRSDDDICFLIRDQVRDSFYDRKLTYYVYRWRSIIYNKYTNCFHRSYFHSWLTFCVLWPGWKGIKVSSTMADITKRFQHVTHPICIDCTIL